MASPRNPEAAGKPVWKAEDPVLGFRGPALGDREDETFRSLQWKFERLKNP